MVLELPCANARHTSTCHRMCRPGLERKATAGVKVQELQCEMGAIKALDTLLAAVRNKTQLEGCSVWMSAAYETEKSKLQGPRVGKML
eukprot:1149413-Pelagomonas_calceolata.AAC.19